MSNPRTLSRRMSSLDDTHTDDESPSLPSPVNTYLRLPSGCHASFAAIATPQNAETKRTVPINPSPQTDRSYTITVGKLQTEDDLQFDRTMQDQMRNGDRNLHKLVMPMMVRVASCIPNFAIYGNTFVSSRMISWTMRITLVHIFILVSFFIAGPQLKRKKYDYGTCDNMLDGITLTVYTGLINIILCLPAIHNKRYQLCNQQNKKTWLLSLCEIIVMLEIPYLVVKLVMHVEQYIANDAYQGCYSSSNDPSDIPVPWPWIVWSICLVVLDFYVYFACWYQITLFNRMRDVALGQRNIIPNAHLFTFSNPDWYTWSASGKEILRIKEGLYDAAKRGHLAELQTYLDEAIRTAGPAFHVKWYTNDLYCCGQLAKSVRNPLHVAIINGRLPIVEALLRCGFDVNAFDKIQTVSFSLSHIYTTIFNVLIFLRTTNFAQTESTTRYGPNQFWSQVLLTPLHLAVIHTDAAIVDTLHRYGADPNINALSNQRKYATPPLFYVECINCLRSLMRMGANHLYIPGNGFYLTAYEVIVLNGFFSLADALVEWGGDIALTPMHLAAAMGDWKKVANFLDAGVDADILGENSCGRFSRTPLHWAAMRGRLRVVQLLLTKCKEDPCDSLGMTPLAWAAIYNHTSVVEALLLAQADPNMVDIYGRSIIHLLGYYESVKGESREKVLILLRDYGCNIHAKMVTTGETALHLALKRGNIMTAKILVRMGLSVTAKDNDGIRALDCAPTSDIQYSIKKVAGQRDVMISYCHSHANFANKVRQALEKQYITTWIDQMDPTGISGGAEWREEIARGIIGASVVLAILSEDYPRSQWCMKELAFAKQHNIPVIGITCGRVVIGDELEVYLWTRQIVDFRSSIVSKIRSGNAVRFEYDEEKFESQFALLLDGLQDEIEERRIMFKNQESADIHLDRVSSQCHSYHSGPTNEFYVYLVHGDCHKSFALTLKNELSATGVHCKIDSAAHPSDAKNAVLDDHCIALIIVLSHLSTASESLRDTLAFAENRNKPIVPIMLSMQTLDLALAYSLSRSAIHHFNECVGFRQSVDQLIPHVRQLHLRRGTSQQTVQTPQFTNAPTAPAGKLRRFLQRLNSQQSELESVIDPTPNSPRESLLSHARRHLAMDTAGRRVLSGITQVHVQPKAATNMRKQRDRTAKTVGFTLLKLPLVLGIVFFLLVFALSEHVAWLGLPTAQATALEQKYVSFVSIPVLERVLPMKHMAQELLRRGYRVSFALPEMYRHWVSDIHGLEFISLGKIVPSTLYSLTVKSSIGNAGMYTSYLASLQYYASFQKPMYLPLLSDYAEDIPSIVVVDRYTFAAMDVCNNLSVPFIINNPYLLLDIDNPPSYVPAPFSRYPMATQTVWQRCANGFHRLRFRLANSALATSLKKTRDELSIPLPSMYNIYGERLVLTNTVFGLENPRPMSPLHRLVGALHKSQDYIVSAPELDAFLARDRDGAVAVVDFGTDVILSLDFIEIIISVLRELECRTIWKLTPEMQKVLQPTGMLESSDIFFSSTTPEDFPSNHSSIRFLLTSGSFYTVQTALCAGKPIITIPFSAEQAEFADRVARAGAGVVIEATKVTTQSLTFAMELIITQPRWTQAAIKLGGLLDMAGGAIEAVNAIIAVSDRGTDDWIPMRDSQSIVKTYLLDVYAVYGAVLCGVAVILRTLLSACFTLLFES
ncbi:transient receptor potential Ca2 channel (TRP-CC) family protein [Thraustotheca clavata]|uniref:Transient receptor potential Ca2 channel (TRP-CC) family protein n=1 Tax=Thraustotheca clavata TaxID=74557 RepID=A0A1V9ZZF9_9STRA|nr:transient receptor potential Ca2 channel (TRP-CC) family protein [Thraustotheca clavata]